MRETFQKMYRYVHALLHHFTQISFYWTYWPAKNCGGIEIEGAITKQIFSKFKKETWLNEWCLGSSKLQKQQKIPEPRIEW